MKDSQTLQAPIFIAGGAILALVVILTGATIPTTIWTTVVFISAFIGFASVVIAGFLSWNRPVGGRYVAAWSMAAAFPLWLSGWVTASVPRYHVRFSILPLVLVFFYLFLAAFIALHSAHRSRSAIVLGILVLVGACSWAGYFAFLLRRGEYNRPGIAIFRLDNPKSTTITIGSDPLHWIDSREEALLSDAGLGGHLSWCSSWGEIDSPTRMIVVCTERPREVAYLAHPMDGSVLYFFDGKKWSRTGSSRFYSLSAMMAPEGEETFLFETVGEGRQGVRAF